MINVRMFDSRKGRNHYVCDIQCKTMSKGILVGTLFRVNMTGAPAGQQHECSPCRQRRLLQPNPAGRAT